MPRAYDENRPRPADDLSARRELMIRHRLDTCDLVVL